MRAQARWQVVPEVLGFRPGSPLRGKQRSLSREGLAGQCRTGRRDPSSRSGGKRQISVQACARADGTAEDDHAAEGFDPILQTHQPRAPRGVGATATIIEDPQVKNVTGHVDGDLHDRGI